MDDKLKPTDSGYAEHVILIASALANANEEFLASELGYDKEFVATVGSRLRNAGIWVKGNLNRTTSQTGHWVCDKRDFTCEIRPLEGLSLLGWKLRGQAIV